MEVTPVMEFYDKIMSSDNEGELIILTIEVQCAVIKKEFTNDTDIMLLQLALKMRANYFMMREMLMIGDMFAGKGDFDPEAAQLEEFAEQELEDFKDGNVVLMGDFKKKDK